MAHLQATVRGGRGGLESDDSSLRASQRWERQSVVPQATGTRLTSGSRHQGDSASLRPPPVPFSSSVVAGRP